MLKDFIKRLLGLVPPQPFPPLVAENEPIRKTTKAELPEGVVIGNWGADKQLQRKSVAADGVEWEKEKANQLGKSPELTKKDLELLVEKQLDIAKAAELKGYWAKNTTIAETATLLGLERGYKQRTIAEYYSTFSKALK